MTLCFLGLGSNLNNPQKQLRRAVVAINNISKTGLLKKSSIFQSTPCGPPSQPLYQNMVIAIKTTLAPDQLLYYCQLIEKRQKRRRKKKWGPRTIDIDLLLYGERIMNTKHLIIPHPYLTKRDFVLIPLAEIAPDLVIPNGKSVNSYLKTCDQFVTGIIK